jgi:hypothetical protein
MKQDIIPGDYRKLIMSRPKTQLKIRFKSLIIHFYMDFYVVVERMNRNWSYNCLLNVSRKNNKIRSSNSRHIS